MAATSYLVRTKKFVETPINQPQQDITVTELQEQVYIITGVLAGAILILFLFVIALIIRIERERKQRIANESRFLNSTDPKIRRGEDMDKRGFSMYQGVPGQPQVPHRTSSLVNELRDYQRDSHSHHAKDSHHNRPASASAVVHHGHGRERDHRRH